jgi:type VI secretion system protein ImpA
MSASWQGVELLQPVTADLPCGDNLEDTPLLSSFDTYRVFGQPMPLDPQPQWAEIRAKSLEALARSKDIRLLAHLGTALLRTDGLGAFAETLVVASGWLQTYWAGIHPQVDEDAILRRNALNYFADPMAVIDGVRRAPLVRSRQHGTVTLRDIDIATGQIQPGEKDLRRDESQINAAFSEMPLEELQQLQQRVADALAAVQRIDATMSERAGAESVPDLAPLSAQLVRADRVLRSQLASRGGATTEDAAAGGNGAGGVVAVGAIKSRQDAIRALDAVADFFRRNEPSSPIPLFVERAKRLVSKDFLEVLADVAPEALSQARAAGGLSQSE